MRMRGGVLATIAGGVAVASALGAAAESPRAAAGTTAPVTSFSFTSPHGEYVGHGQRATYTSPTTTMAVQAPYGPNPGPTPDGGFEMNVRSTSPAVWWSVRMFPAPGQSLHAGTFAAAQRFAASGIPGLDVSGQGRGCNHSYGSFTILSMATDAGGVITEMDATFTQHCERLKAPALTGEVRWNAPVPPPKPTKPPKHHG